jgi:hypothetical protein
MQWILTLQSLQVLDVEVSCEWKYNKSPPLKHPKLVRYCTLTTFRKISKLENLSQISGLQISLQIRNYAPPEKEMFQTYSF